MDSPQILPDLSGTRGHRLGSSTRLAWFLLAAVAATVVSDVGSFVVSGPAAPSAPEVVAVDARPAPEFPKRGVTRIEGIPSNASPLAGVDLLPPVSVTVVPVPAQSPAPVVESAPVPAVESPALPVVEPGDVPAAVPGPAAAPTPVPAPRTSPTASPAPSVPSDEMPVATEPEPRTPGRGSENSRHNRDLND